MYDTCCIVSPAFAAWITAAQLSMQQTTAVLQSFHCYLSQCPGASSFILWSTRPHTIQNTVYQMHNRHNKTAKYHIKHKSKAYLKALFTHKILCSSRGSPVNTEPEQSSSNPMTQFPTYRVSMHYLYPLICVFVVVYRDSGESVDIIPIVHLMWRLCAAAAGVR